MSQKQQVAVTPPPWELKGRGYIFLLDLPDAITKQELALLPWKKTSFLSAAMMMLVDYTDSAVGPYYEVLFIPGRIETPAGSYWHISKIYVSSEASAASGRANWGIPKEIADFSFRYRDDGADVSVRVSGAPLADFSIRHKSCTVPVTTKIIPEALRLFYQRLDDSEFIFAPQADGRVGLAEINTMKTHSPYFPALNGDRVRVALFTEDFKMTFPICHSIRSL